MHLTINSVDWKTFLEWNIFSVFPIFSFFFPSYSLIYSFTHLTIHLCRQSNRTQGRGSWSFFPGLQGRCPFGSSPRARHFSACWERPLREQREGVEGIQMQMRSPHCSPSPACSRKEKTDEKLLGDRVGTYGGISVHGRVFDQELA